MRNILKLRFDDGYSGSKKCKEAAFRRSLESGGRFFAVEFGKKVFSVAL
jgi:hypothetical protein